MESAVEQISRTADCATVTAPISDSIAEPAPSATAATRRSSLIFFQQWASWHACLFFSWLDPCTDAARTRHCLKPELAATSGPACASVLQESLIKHSPI